MFKDDLLKDKRILVTGGGTGLGKEMATHFAKHGAQVYICGRRGNVLEDTANDLVIASNRFLTLLRAQHKQILSIPM